MPFWNTDGDLVMPLRLGLGYAALLLVGLLAPACSSEGPGKTVPVEPSPPSEQKGSIRVTTTTAGDEYSRDRDGFMLTVDQLEPTRIAPRGTMNHFDLAVGNHIAQLGDVAENCAVMGENPRSAVVLSSVSTAVDFSITCATLTATIVVKTLTSGSGRDPDGYTVAIDGGLAQAIGSGEIKTFPELATGRHEILLGGMDFGCALHSPNPRVVILFGNSTSTSNFHVIC